MQKIAEFSPASRHLKRIAVWALIDFVIIFFAYTAAFFVRSITAALQYRDSVLFIATAAGLTVMALYAFGTYHRIWEQTSGHGITTILAGIGVATLVVASLDLVGASQRPLPLSVVALANVFAFGGIVGARYRSRLIPAFTWRWRAIWLQEFPHVTNLLIVGAGEAGQTLAWRLKHRWTNECKDTYHIIGFVDADRRKHGLRVEECPVLGGYDAIPHLVKHHSIDLIVLALHHVAGAEFREILEYCEATNARIKIVPDELEAIDSTQNAPLLREIQPEDILGRKSIGRHEAVDFSLVTGKVVLVTGAAGSIGSEIVRQMRGCEPVTLIALDNNESGLHDLAAGLQDGPNPLSLTAALVDITDEKATRRVFEQYRPQVVFHAAAYKHVPMLEAFPYESVRVNIGGTRTVARLAREFGVERFVLISTDKAVDPSSVMGASKRICELLVHSLAQQAGNRTLFTAVRFGNVLGSRGSVVPTFNRQLDRGGPLTVTHPEMARYFMTIPEAVNLVIHAACLTGGDDLFMLDMGEEIRIVELAERMIRLRGLVPYKDIAIQFTGIRPGEKLNEQLHHEVEDEMPTVHPGIVKLAWDHLMDVQADFLAKIAALTDTCSPECSHLPDRVPYLNQAAATGQQPVELHPCLVCLLLCTPEWTADRISLRVSSRTRVDARKQWPGEWSAAGHVR